MISEVFVRHYRVTHFCDEVHATGIGGLRTQHLLDVLNHLHASAGDSHAISSLQLQHRFNSQGGCTTHHSFDDDPVHFSFQFAHNPSARCWLHFVHASNDPAYGIKNVFPEGGICHPSLVRSSARLEPN